MAKLKIAQNPTFAATVQIPRVGGEPVPVEFRFRYMDRLALAEMYDRWNKELDAWLEQAKGDQVDWVASTAGEIDRQARQLKEIVVGWDLEDEFGDAAIADLVRTCTAAPKAVTDAFQAAYNSARLGN